MSRVHIGREPADDEPDERPDRLGAELLSIKGDAASHGQWWTVATAGESYVKQAVRRLTGKIDPPGVPGLRDLEGWEARPKPVTNDEGERWQLRVRYTPPTPTLDSEADAKATAAFDALRRGEQPDDDDEPATEPADPHARFAP